jgi:hypothetical protein
MMTAMLKKNVRHSYSATSCMDRLLLPPMDTTLLITDELNIARAMATPLENA